MIRAALLFLPLVLAGSALAQPITVDAPPGVILHLSGIDAIEDGAGQVYYATRDRNSPSRGDLVFTVRDGQSVVVLEPGVDVAYGNGSLAIIGGGGYLVTVNQSNQVVLFAIPGWVSK